MTELDEIVLVTKMAWALRDCNQPGENGFDDPECRRWFYLSRIGLDLKDYMPYIATRLDEKAYNSETQRRRIVNPEPTQKDCDAITNAFRAGVLSR